MRLIDADTLIEDLQYDVELDARALDSSDVVGNREPIQFDKDCKQNCIDLLRNAPTADSVKHGRWMGTVCSVCGESFSEYYDCNYCPNCGAKMDGDSE